MKGHADCHTGRVRSSGQCRRTPPVERPPAETWRHIAARRPRPFDEWKTAFDTNRSPGCAMQRSLQTRVVELSNLVNRHLADRNYSAAYCATSRALPDARIIVEPTITVRGMRSTPNATANATLQLIAAARQRLIPNLSHRTPAWRYREPLQGQAVWMRMNQSSIFGEEKA
jgi:hypothetical protein